MAAIVATHCNRAREGRRGKERISVTKRYLMAEKQVLVLMKLVILANHRPNVLARFAHRVFRKTSLLWRESTIRNAAGLYIGQANPKVVNMLSLIRQLSPLALDPNPRWQ